MSCDILAISHRNLWLFHFRYLTSYNDESPYFFLSYIFSQPASVPPPTSISQFADQHSFYLGSRARREGNIEKKWEREGASIPWYHYLPGSWYPEPNLPSRAQCTSCIMLGCSHTALRNLDCLNPWWGQYEDFSSHLHVKCCKYTLETVIISAYACKNNFFKLAISKTWFKKEAADCGKFHKINKKWCGGVV